MEKKTTLRTYGPRNETNKTLQRSSEGLHGRTAERLRKELASGGGAYWTVLPGDRLDEWTVALKGFAYNPDLEFLVNVHFLSDYPLAAPIVKTECGDVFPLKDSWCPAMRFDALAVHLVMMLQEVQEVTNTRLYSPQS